MTKIDRARRRLADLPYVPFTGQYRGSDDASAHLTREARARTLVELELADFEERVRSLAELRRAVNRIVGPVRAGEAEPAYGDAASRRQHRRSANRSTATGGVRRRARRTA